MLYSILDVGEYNMISMAKIRVKYFIQMVCSEKQRPLDSRTMKTDKDEI